MKEILKCHGFNFVLIFDENILWKLIGDKCGMTVNANCGQCDAPLVNYVLKLEDERWVSILKSPNGYGKIKSPLCCEEDMSCAI